MSLWKEIERLAPGIEPRWVEGFIRVGHPTVGHLYGAELELEIKIAVACVKMVGAVKAEATAKSFGL
jgi:hypothetical protein